MKSMSMKNRITMAILMAMAALEVGCTAREALIGAGAATAGAAAGYYAGDKYDVDAHNRKENDNDKDD